jgi:hypothetical protein
MGTDSGEETRCVRVPADLIDYITSGIMDAVIRWHQENRMEPDPLICDAAVLVSAKMLTAEFNGIPACGGMVH